MLKTLLFCSILISVTNVYSLGYYPPVGAYSQAVGGIGLFNNNAFSAHHNASLIPDCKKPQFGLSVQNKFAIQSFNKSALCVTIPYKKSGYGFKYFSNSYAVLNDQIIGLQFAQKVHPLLSIGLSFNHHRFAIQNYGSSQSQTMEFSLTSQLSEFIQTAFVVSNPFSSKINPMNEERLSKTIRFGLKYKLNKKVNLLSELEKNANFNPNFKIGADYQSHPHLQWRVGISTLQPSFNFGLGYLYKKCQFEFASSIHQTLGISNTLSFIFEFGNK